jgi:hypothetical protein
MTASEYGAPGAAELRDQMAAGIRAVADANHQNLCACRSWPDACLSGYKPDQWEHGDEATFLTAALERLAESTRTAAEAKYEKDLSSLQAFADRLRQTDDERHAALLAETERLRGERDTFWKRAMSNGEVIVQERHRAERAEAAIGQAREILPFFGGQITGIRELYPVLADAMNATYERFVAALSPAGGSEKGCCAECGGSGHSGDEAVPGGLCWGCRGTGHPHDGPCDPGGSEENKEDPK